ncbi:hypothetical protein [Schnuerera sp.]|uniref:hypothetical protein n=1 Tax=Schnuerera sp. TaxID=2794844 RepID=UPI002C3111E3|nr:hypothetical protein [Schnuerera sp.]HSH36209.1 hypothetical protein [Schnuerera sp.]
MNSQYEVCLAALMEYEEINKMLNYENQILRNENKKLKKEKEELKETIRKYRQYVENLD